MNDLQMVGLFNFDGRELGLEEWCLCLTAPLPLLLLPFHPHRHLTRSLMLKLAALLKQFGVFPLTELELAVVQFV